jgi:hypothetical protein
MTQWILDPQPLPPAATGTAALTSQPNVVNVGNVSIVLPPGWGAAVTQTHSPGPKWRRA